MTEKGARQAEAASLVVGLSLAVTAALVIADPGWPGGHVRGAATIAARREPAPARPKPKPRPRRIVVHQARPAAVEQLARAGLPLVCGGDRRRVVALTFDDGPGPYTARLVDVLRRDHARATFFVVGDRIAEWPRLPATEAKVGAVGDHTWSHAFLPELSSTAAAVEVVRGREALERAVHANVRLFRPPYEGRTAAVQQRLQARGMLEVLWSIDPSDYLARRTTAQVVRYVAARLRPGSIVLLHDIQPRTAEVVRRLLPVLRRRHLRPVGIPELVRVDAPSRRLLAAGGPGCWG